MKSTNHTNNIIRFLNNEMSTTEEAEFKDEMNHNDALCEAFLKIMAESKVQNEINQIVKQSLQKEKKNTLLKITFFLKIAAILFIIITPSVFLIQYYITSNDTLINNKNMSYFSGDIMRGDTNPDLSQKELAFSLYSNKKYPEAAKIFLAISDTSTTAYRFELYAGISFLWCNTKEDMEKAKVSLEDLTNSKSAYHTAASWFYAIALYETGEKSEAKKIFIKFANNDSSNFKKQEAIKILNEFYGN